MHKMKNCPFSTGTDAYLNAAYSKSVFRSNHPGSVAFELRLIGQSPFFVSKLIFETTVLTRATPIPTRATPILTHANDQIQKAAIFSDLKLCLIGIEFNFARSLSKRSFRKKILKIFEIGLQKGLSKRGCFRRRALRRFRKAAFERGV